MILYIWLAALLAAIYLYLRQIYSRFTRYGVKQETPIPLLGNLAPVIFRQKHMMDISADLYTESTNERFVGRFDFTKPTLLIKDLELLKKIGVKDSEYFLDHAFTVSSEVDPLFGRALFTLRGQEWKDMRSMMSPAFTSSKMKNMVPFIMEVGDQMMVSLKKQLREIGKSYIDLDSRELATRYANDVIASCAFGLRVDSHTDPSNDFYKMGHVASNFTFAQVLKFFGNMLSPDLMKKLGIAIFSESTTSFFKHLVTGTMKDREERGILRPDMIHLLMEAKKGRLTHDDNSGKDADAGFATVEESDFGKKKVTRAWTDIDLTAQAFIFFLAGFETISTAMTFLMYELALHPEVQERLAQEIKEQEKSGKFDYGAVQKMKYLDMVVSETLRRWPPAIAISRLCLQDYNIGKPNDEAEHDYIICPSDLCGRCVRWTSFIEHVHEISGKSWRNCGRPDNVYPLLDPKYFPDPLKFDPERFSEENKDKIVPYSYMPFGVGPRNCIGSRFALCEIKVMIYQLLLHMELSPCEKTPIPPTVAPGGFNLRLKGGHYLRMKLRE